MSNARTSKQQSWISMGYVPDSHVFPMEHKQLSVKQYARQAKAKPLNKAYRCEYQPRNDINEGRLLPSIIVYGKDEIEAMRHARNMLSKPIIRAIEVTE